MPQTGRQPADERSHRREADVAQRRNQQQRARPGGERNIRKNDERGHQHQLQDHQRREIDRHLRQEQHAGRNGIQRERLPTAGVAFAGERPIASQRAGKENGQPKQPAADAQLSGPRGGRFASPTETPIPAPAAPSPAKRAERAARASNPCGSATTANGGFDVSASCAPPPQRGGWAIALFDRRYPPGVQVNNSVGQAAALCGVVTGEADGPPRVPPTLEQPLQPQTTRRVQIGRGLVEHDQPRLVHQRPGDRQPLSHALRQLSGRAVGLRLDSPFRQ